MVIHFLCLLCR